MNHSQRQTLWIGLVTLAAVWVGFAVWAGNNDESRAYLSFWAGPVVLLALYIRAAGEKKGIDMNDAQRRILWRSLLIVSACVIAYVLVPILVVYLNGYEIFGSDELDAARWVFLAAPIIIAALYIRAGGG